MNNISGFSNYMQEKTDDSVRNGVWSSNIGIRNWRSRAGATQQVHDEDPKPNPFELKTCSNPTNRSLSLNQRQALVGKAREKLNTSANYFRQRQRPSKEESEDLNRRLKLLPEQPQLESGVYMYG
mmetsp:Transcript_18073/g.27863  ORF Transcript_18073/g.27863 Transcript_18073/m.27863 type:complete len:125 (+) Transcript_18073:222-596(+)